MQQHRLSFTQTSGGGPSGATLLTRTKSLPRTTVSDFSFSNVGLSVSQAESIWHALQRAVEEIFNGNNAKLRFEELHRNAYTLVLHHHGEMLYRGVEECIRKRMLRVAEEVARASDASLLDVLVTSWENHKIKMTMMKDILMYMDKVYCRENGLQPVYDKGLLLFRDHVVRAGNIAGRMRNVMMENVKSERTGEQIDGVLLKNACLLLLEVNLNQPELYHLAFERELLQSTRTFYASESQTIFSGNTCADYMKQIEYRILEEEARCDHYFDKTTKVKIKAILHDELLEKYSKQLVDNPSGAVTLLKNNSIDDIARMYNLFTRVPECMTLVRHAVGNLIRTTGTNIVRDVEYLKQPKVFIEKILELRQMYMNFLQYSFKQDRTFAKCIKESIEYFLNLDTRGAQYLSMYFDDLLRKQSSTSSSSSSSSNLSVSASVASSNVGISTTNVATMNDAELDAKCDELLSIFRYLQDKDIFEEYYKQYLSTRLLDHTSSNNEIEKLMISKLKTECGHQFTSRLEGMFRDMEMSKLIMQTWKEQKTAPGSCELSVSVLTTGFWPIPPMPQCILPTEARNATESFRRFYMSQHSGRKLTWQTALGQAELRCTFEGGMKDGVHVPVMKELVVHTYQMCILMLFNTGDKLSFAEIQSLTNIPADELTRHLLSLAHPQVKILLKNPPGKACAPDHRFKYNTKYTSKLYRNKISVLSKAAAGVGVASDDPSNTDASSAAAASSSASSSSTTAVPESVQEQRKYSVEASLVRIMKSRKTLDHNLLVSEVIRQLAAKFPVEPQFVKKRIEALIEREYIERDPNDRRIYIYKA